MYYVVLDAAKDSQDPSHVLGIFKDDELLAERVKRDHERRYRAEYGDNWWSRELVVLSVPDIGTIYPLDYRADDPWGKRTLAGGSSVDGCRGR